MKPLSMALFASALLVSTASLAAPTPVPRDPPAPPVDAQAIDSAEPAAWRSRADARKGLDEQRRAAQEAVAKAKRKRDAKAARERLAALPKPDLAPDPFLIRVQILLDRAHASPGAIDGRDGDNLKKAVRAFRVMRGMPIEGGIDDAFWTELSKDSANATRIYEINREDVDARYVERVPSDYAKLARLKWIGFSRPTELLAERFHMDEGLLKALNPGVDFGRMGTRILIAETGAPPAGKVVRIVIDKAEGEMRGYDDTGAILIAAPATIGSPDTPSPTGEMKVTKAFPDPHYVYDPKKNFQQGKNRRRLVLPPGPNGPVGSMWIDLTKPTYGIHGTPEPSQISKTASHGCVRLTNWDAGQLGAMIVPNTTTVTFEGG